MSTYSGEAAEQVVKMYLEGAEVAVKLAGSGAKHLAILLYSVLRDQKKTKGKIRLTNMLRSGKDLKVFAVMDGDLQKFCTEAKRYGVLYTVLKDRDSTDGLTDVMVRAEDASKINRIFERFHLTTVDMGSVKAQIEQMREDPTAVPQQPEPVQPSEATASLGDPDMTMDPDEGLPQIPMTDREKLDEFLDKLLAEAEQPDPNREEASETKSPPSAPSSSKNSPIEKAPGSDGEPKHRPSVKKELEQICKEMDKEKADKAKQPERSPQHKAPKKKRKKVKTR